MRQPGRENAREKQREKEPRFQLLDYSVTIGEYKAKMDIQEQLAALRQRVQTINDRYSQAGPAPRPPVAFVEELLTGQIVETPHGSHFETEKLHATHTRHGSVEISDLLSLPHDLLASLSNGAIPSSHPTRWAFLDTETTGLAGGSGTYAFLVGIGSVEEDGFRVRQFFMRDYGEEASQLHAVAEYLQRFDVLITYNGKTYDQPLLETRFRMCRARHPFSRMEHLDLLFGARRLWKQRMENCRLSYLEQQVLGVERDGDVPGSLIPYIFFEYVRTGRALRLLPVFHHNVMDIVSLACLTAIVPEAYRNPETVPVRHGSDLLGLGRWLLQVGRPDQSLALMRRAVEIGLPDHLLFHTLLEIGLLLKKQGDEVAALVAFTDLAGYKNPCRVRAFEELAKYYEHRERNYTMALEMTCSALAECDTPEIRHRESRLRQRVKVRSASKPATLFPQSPVKRKAR
jgi:uncharacterized protein YprB with RNaseH-like and TPR domain